MRVLALSDIHGDIDELERILREAADYELILVLGDITDTGVDDYVGRARAILDLLDEQGVMVKAIPGNMDDERVLELLMEYRFNLHKDMISMADMDFVGFGGGSTPFDTPFEPDDEERGQVLATLLERTAAPRRAIVSHQPPHNTRIDRTSDGTQAGSKALRQLIEDEEIALVLSGHIHEAAGADRYNGTVMVNPGPVQEGQYALIDIGEEIEVELRG